MGGEYATWEESAFSLVTEQKEIPCSNSAMGRKAVAK